MYCDCNNNTRCSITVPAPPSASMPMMYKTNRIQHGMSVQLLKTTNTKRNKSEFEIINTEFCTYITSMGLG